MMMTKEDVKIPAKRKNEENSTNAAELSKNHFVVSKKRTPSCCELDDNFDRLGLHFGIQDGRGCCCFSVCF